MRKIAGAALLALLLTPAAQAQAQMHCAAGEYDGGGATPATLYACASMTVSFDAATQQIVLRVQNADLWAVANGLNPAGHGYAIAGVGIEAPATGAVSLHSVVAEDGTLVTGNAGSFWSFTQNVDGFMVEAGSTATGVNGGILGCNDTFGNSYFRTCNLAVGGTANIGWVAFRFQTQLSDWDSDKALLAMRAKGGDWSYRCSDAPDTPNGEECTPPTTTVPEPISMVLLATGLAGVGIMRRRRRNGEVVNA